MARSHKRGNKKPNFRNSREKQAISVKNLELLKNLSGEQ